MATRSTLVLAALVLISATCGYAQVQKDTTVRHELYTVVEQVQKVLQGGDPDSIKKFISPEAYIISGKNMTHLLDALKAKNREAILGEDSTRQGVEIIARSNDNEDAIYIVLKTVNAKKEDARYHLLVLYREPKLGWQIHIWHAGV